MDDSKRRILRLINLMRERGHLAPDHATAAAGKLLEAEPLPPGFAFVAAGLVRHAAILDPFDREKARLASDVNAPMRHAPFDSWLRLARELTEDEPIPENIPMPGEPAALVEYMKRQPANAMRLPALLRLAGMGANDSFQAGIQYLSGSQSGLLAAPIMAWHAHFLGETLLAEMLLDEGVHSFPADNLRALFALKSGDRDAASVWLVDSLESEPFQPAILEILAGLDRAAPQAAATKLELLHGRIARRMNLADMEAINRDLRDQGGVDFLLSLAKAMPACRANALVFWQTLAPCLD